MEDKIKPVREVLSDEELKMFLSHMEECPENRYETMGDALRGFATDLQHKAKAFERMAEKN